MRTSSGRRRPVWAALGLAALILASAAAFAAAAHADDAEPPAAATEGGEPADAGTMDALEKRLLDNPLTAGVLLVVRFVPVGVGVLLLVLLYLKRDKIRGGLIPPPPPAHPTTPYQPLMSVFIAVGGVLLVPVVVAVGIMVGSGNIDQKNPPMWTLAVGTAVGAAIVAALVMGRRRRLLRTPELVARYGASAAPPDAEGTQPPGLLNAFGLGWWTLCVAALVVVPISLVWALLLEQMGIRPETQDLVKEVVTTKDDAVPWLIAALGVIAAPLAEESAFRALLYPAVRSVFRGRRGGVWYAAIIVSALFAVIHFNWLALVPLFALAMVLTWVFEKTNSLAAVIFAHALHNLFSLVPLLLLRLTG